jgi:hypothetical protein
VGLVRAPFIYSFKQKQINMRVLSIALGILSIVTIATSFYMIFTVHTKIEFTAATIMLIVGGIECLIFLHLENKAA